MNTFNKCLITVDGSEFDNNLYTYSKAVGKTFGIDKIIIVHVLSDLLDSDFLPEAITNRHNFQMEIKRKILSNANKSGLSLELDDVILLHDISPYNAIRKFVVSENFDLIVMGKKDNTNHSGLTAKRVTNRINVNILLVSNQIDRQINRLLVPFDYDELSARILKLVIKSAPKECSIDALHINRILDHDHYFGISLNPDYNDQKLKEDEKYISKFITKYNIDKERINIIREVESYHRIAFRIKEEQKSGNHDLIILGAKGHSIIEKILIGSTVEKLVHILDQGALLVMR